MNLVYNIANRFRDADAWEHELYAFLCTKYDLLPYEEVPFNSAHQSGTIAQFKEVVIALDMDPDVVILDWYHDAGPFKLYRSCIPAYGANLINLLDVCQIDDDVVAVEAKLVMS